MKIFKKKLLDLLREEIKSVLREAPPTAPRGMPRAGSHGRAPNFIPAKGAGGGLVHKVAFHMTQDMMNSMGDSSELEHPADSASYFQLSDMFYNNSERQGKTYEDAHNECERARRRAIQQYRNEGGPGAETLVWSDEDHQRCKRIAYDITIQFASRELELEKERIQGAQWQAQRDARSTSGSPVPMSGSPVLKERLLRLLELDLL